MIISFIIAHLLLFMKVPIVRLDSGRLFFVLCEFCIRANYALYKLV